VGKDRELEREIFESVTSYSGYWVAKGQVVLKRSL